MQIKTCVRWISQFVFAVVFLSVLLIQAGLASATQVPTISPSGGEYTSSQTVTIGNIDSGDTAYYTTDGSNPKTSSTATEYTTPFTVSQSELVLAAVKDSSGDWSSVTGARFIIDNSSNSNYYNNGSNTNYDNNGSNGSNNWYSENRNRNRSRNQGSDYNIKNWDRNLDNNWDNNW